MANVLDVKGRYFNGGAIFNATITNGELSVNVKSLTVQGKPLPENIMAQVRQNNFANSFNQNLKNSSKPNPFERFESHRSSRHSTLIITPKSN